MVFWFVRNALCDSLSLGGGGGGGDEGDKETCERRFLYAPAGNDLKPPPPPSSLTIRSFPSELIDMGSSLRAGKQMHVS